MKESEKKSDRLKTYNNNIKLYITINQPFIESLKIYHPFKSYPRTITTSKE